MLLGGLQKTTLIDYPDKVACTVFLAGCNFRCPFCYSAELVLPERIKKQPRISEKQFFDFLKKRRGQLDGVVVCGGEPTLQAGLPNFIRKIKRLGFLVKLDTNGSNPSMLGQLIRERLIDYIAMDVKAPLKVSKYKEATGNRADLEKIKKSIDIIKKSGVNYEFRTTLVPGLHTKQDVVLLAQVLFPAQAYFLQSFKAGKTLDPKFRKVKPYSREFFSGVKKEIEKLFKICGVR